MNELMNERMFYRSVSTHC